METSPLTAPKPSAPNSIIELDSDPPTPVEPPLDLPHDPPAPPSAPPCHHRHTEIKLLGDPPVIEGLQSHHPPQ